MNKPDEHAFKKFRSDRTLIVASDLVNLHKLLFQLLGRRKIDLNFISC